MIKVLILLLFLSSCSIFKPLPIPPDSTVFMAERISDGETVLIKKETESCGEQCVFTYYKIISIVIDTIDIRKEYRVLLINKD